MSGRLTVLLICAGLGFIGLAQLGAQPKLIWNRTESVPRGLYVLSSPQAPLERGQLVAYLPTQDEAQWLEELGAIGPGWPILKRVAGLEGDDICVHSDSLLINRQLAAKIVQTDHHAHELPRRLGCQRLGSGDVLLLGDHASSLDGRYFGAQPSNRILGQAKLVWRVSNRLAEPE